MKIKVTSTLKDILKRELVFADFAVKQLEIEMQPFEKKYSMEWKDFIKKFESGKMGDERILFEWYALASFTKDWYETKEEIEKTFRAS